MGCAALSTPPAPAQTGSWSCSLETRQELAGCMRQSWDVFSKLPLRTDCLLPCGPSSSSLFPGDPSQAAGTAWLLSWQSSCVARACKHQPREGTKPHPAATLQPCYPAAVPTWSCVTPHPGHPVTMYLCHSAAGLHCSPAPLNSSSHTTMYLCHPATLPACSHARV